MRNSRQKCKKDLRRVINPVHYTLKNHFSFQLHCALPRLRFKNIQYIYFIILIKVVTRPTIPATIPKKVSNISLVTIHDDNESFFIIK